MKPFNSKNQPGLCGRGMRPSEKGMALVITLILLAVITFMAVTFLVISRSERGAVTTTTDQTIARLGADSALEHAKIDLLAPMMAQDNPFLVGLHVSTNYFNELGFSRGLYNPTNVNYDYLAGTILNPQPLTPDDFIQNVGNLLFRPRVPVFMRNRTTGRQDFQFYYDVNQNGRFEPSGLHPVILDEAGTYLRDENGIIVSNYFVGDPEWNGELEFPGRPHSGTNRFVSRWAYIISPVGQTLDLNYMHNAARLRNPQELAVRDGFVRNQGVGTWEINAGALFTDLNTNFWFNTGPYFYNSTDLGGWNTGRGFDAAASLLRFRYRTDARTLWSPATLFGTARAQALARDGYDTFGAGALNFSTAPYTIDPDVNRILDPWPGAYSTNNFASPTELLDRNKVGAVIADGLLQATRALNTYDRYTFHRLLAQVGTESPPEEPKINVNYKNVLNGRIVPDLQTNFVDWTPLDFFTNAATKLLANAGFNFSLTNIQIWPTNFYTPSVHRALQLAANIYDATTNEPMPSVFRPLFGLRPLGAGQGIFIIGYTNVPTVASLLGVQYRDPLNAVTLGGTNIPSGLDMVYGVPYVVGAKKGFPNFNEFAMETKLQFTRKLEFVRQGSGLITNQMVTVSMQNNFGLEGWNSYLTTNAENIRITARVEVFPSLTNRVGKLLHPVAVSTNVAGIVASTNFNIGPGKWRAFVNGTTTANDGSFLKVLTNFTLMLPHSSFSEKGQSFETPAHGRFERNEGFPLQDWGMNMRVRIIFSMVATDGNGDHFIDLVNLADSIPTMNLAELLQKETRDSVVVPTKDHRPDGSLSAMWLTNRPNWSHDVSVPTFGVLNQIAVSANEGGLVSPQWPIRTNQAAIDFFRHQFGLGAKFGANNYSITNTFYAPYSPTREIYILTRWQANDPLVHYTSGDLTDQNKPFRYDYTAKDSTVKNIGFLNERYEPWAFPAKKGSASWTKLSLKDALVRRSDDWDFPTNKIANVGWLGRVHRGTPWQTVYLKSDQISSREWNQWAGSGLTYTNVGQVKPSVAKLDTLVNDTSFSRPMQDWAIPDLFTAAINDNATRGQLSINQDGVAAWSAVLSGVPVLTNMSAGAFTNIQPAAVDPALQVIVDGINRTRTARAGKVFRRLAEICSVPELTVASPYIQHDGPIGSTRDTVSDAVYERIPQQVLGLLRCEDTPKFVVYSYGQSLKPAAGSIITSGPYAGMCTNYAVTAEVATRAVIRVDGAPANPRVTVENFTIVPP